MHRDLFDTVPHGMHYAYAIPQSDNINFYEVINEVVILVEAGDRSDAAWPDCKL